MSLILFKIVTLVVVPFLRIHFEVRLTLGSFMRLSTAVHLSFRLSQCIQSYVGPFLPEVLPYADSYSNNHDLMIRFSLICQEVLFHNMQFVWIYLLRLTRTL